MHDDSGEPGHFGDVFVDVDRITIAGSLCVAVRLIGIDCLRDGQQGITPIRLLRARFRADQLSTPAANENTEQSALNTSAELIACNQLDRHGLAGGLFLHRDDPSSGGYPISGMNGGKKLHVLLAVDQAQEVSS